MRAVAESIHHLGNSLLRSQDSGVLLHRFPGLIGVLAHATILTLMKSSLDARKAFQSCRPPGECKGWLLDVTMTTFSQLLVVDLGHKTKVDTMMPFSKLLELFLTSLIGGADVLHPAPRAASWTEEDLVCSSSISSRKVGLQGEVPPFLRSKGTNLHAKSLSKLGHTAFTRVDFPELSRSLLFHMLRRVWVM